MTAPPPLPTAPSVVHTVAPLPPSLTSRIGSSGYLEQPWLGRGLLMAGVLLALLGIGAALLARRRGRRVLPRLPGRLTGSLLVLMALLPLLAGAGVLVNSYVGYVPTLSALLHGPDGAGAGRYASKVVAVDIASATARVRGPALVYLPPGYSDPRNAARRYPVVYLMYGTPGRPQDWFLAGRVPQTMDLLLAGRYLGPMIVVSPTSSAGYWSDDECLDAPGRAPQLEHYLSVDVVGAIDRSFRTLPDRDHRAIGGMSSGAFCSLNVGLHHLHRFSVILASAPYGDPGPGPLTGALHGDRSLWRANSPAFYLPLWHFAARVAVFLDAGSRDRHATGTSLRLARQLADAGQSVVFRTVPGERHTWKEARAELPYALVFAWRHFGAMGLGGSDARDAAQFRSVLGAARALVVPARQPARPTTVGHPQPCRAGCARSRNGDKRPSGVHARG